jgi:hypothetical protein
MVDADQPAWLMSRYARNSRELSALQPTLVRVTIVPRFDVSFELRRRRGPDDAPQSDGYGFYDRELPSMPDRRAAKPRGFEEYVDFSDTSLLATGHDQHVHIHECW